VELISLTSLLRQEHERLDAKQALDAVASEAQTAILAQAKAALQVQSSFPFKYMSFSHIRVQMSRF